MPDDKTQQARPPQKPDDVQGERDPLIGKVIGGRYKVEKQIGEGGMGVVYKAVQTGLERDVVVKVLSDDRMGDETSIKRFEREAKSLSKIDHSNIVTIHDFGEEGDLGYIVMEYVDGIRLDQLIEHRSGLPLDVLGPIAVQILDAVGEAHRLNLIHRDLKPSNIMLTERRGTQHFVKILDFGLAKLVSGATQVTADDSIVGSVPFLSPEQIKGGDVDERVDVYALGIVFYYALTGRKPFQGSNASVLYDQVHNAPPPLHLHVQHPDRIPKPVTDLIEETLRKNPDERPKDAKAFLDRLFEAVDSPDRIAPPWMQSGDSSGSVRAQPAQPGHSAAGEQQADNASQEYMQRPPSTDDALKRVDTSTGRTPDREAPPQQQSPAGRRAAAQSGSTAQVDESEEISMAWFAGTAGLAAVVAVGAFAVFSGQIDLLGSSTSQVQSNAASNALPPSIKTGIEDVESLIAAGKLDEAKTKLGDLATRAPPNVRWQQVKTRLTSQIQAKINVEQGDAHVSNGKLDKAEIAYEKAAQVLDDETLDWKLEKIDALGVVELEDVPKGTLHADGHRLQRNSTPVVVPTGDRTLTVQRDGEKVWSADVTVERADTVAIAAADGKMHDTSSGTESSDEKTDEPADPEPVAEPSGAPSDETDDEATGAAPAEERGARATEDAPETSPEPTPTETEEPTTGGDHAPAEQNGESGDKPTTEKTAPTEPKATGSDDKKSEDDGPGLLPVE